MARGSRSDGQAQWAAQQRREADRQAREAVRLQREAERQAKEAARARQAEHVVAQQQLAESKTEDVARQVGVLDHLLAEAVRRPPLRFDDLKVKARMPAIQYGYLEVAGAVPAWHDFAPLEPRGTQRWFGGAKRYQEELAAAKARFAAAQAAFVAAEGNRLQALTAAKAEHRHQVEVAQQAAVTQHRTVDARRSAFQAGETEAVEWFVEQVLRASSYPAGFPRQWQVAYRPENRDVVVEFELPPQQVVPNVREYRYVRARDSIDPVPRPVADGRQRYARLIACVALRTLHEIFSATSADVIEAVVFNGRVSTIDRATGKNARPHLVSVEAERSTFAEFVLTEVEPAACLKHLNALVSPNPFDLEAVEPFIAFDLKRFRFVDAADELAGLDHRRNLLTLTPTEFEHLVKDLFVAMGSQAWRTIPSKDGGVDAVATSKNLFFGGVCLIQAKRWTGLVGLDAVHALTGVMTDHNATTGVLVTTSWFSRVSEQFAQRNRITLINGAELKHLLKEHLGLDVVPGTTPPKRLKPSDNLQTGKPGPAAS